MVSNRSSVAAQRSPISEILNIPVANKQKKKATTGKTHVLTSAERLTALQEKENEKYKKQKKKSKEKRKPIEKAA